MGKVTPKVLKSFKEDKAVDDNVVESWLCVDCGANTAPGCLSGPEIRLALALNGEAPQSYDNRTEIYHVKDPVWEAAGMRAWNGCLCVGCIERRLGRRLRPKDFATHDRRVFALLPSTDRLLDRRGYARVTVMTDDGEREVIVDKRAASEIEAERERRG